MREVIDDLPGDFARIKILRALGGDAFQRAGQLGMHKLFADFMQLPGLVQIKRGAGFGFHHALQAAG